MYVNIFRVYFVIDGMVRQMMDGMNLDQTRTSMCVMVTDMIYIYILECLCQITLY